jgi:hypothetical protein
MARASIRVVLGVVVLLALGAELVTAQTVTMQFPVARDTSIAAWGTSSQFGPDLWDPDGDGVKAIPDWWLNSTQPDGSPRTEAFSNAGGLPALRAKESGEHRLLMDWDTNAINQWVGENTKPGDTVTWKLGIYPIDSSFDDTQLDQDGTPVPVGVYVQTLESENDWGEGDQEVDFPNLEWSRSANEGEGAATQNFARTYYLVDENGDRADPMNVDLERSVPWIDNDFGTIGGNPDHNAYSVNSRGDQFEAGNPIPDFTNADTFLSAEVGDAVDNGTAATVDLDADLVDALLNDEVNRGLVFGPDGAGNNPLGQIDGGDWRIWSREGSGEMTDGGPQKLPDTADYPGPFAPFLEITVEPGAGALLGDVNLDGQVNGLDVDPFVDTLLNGPYLAEADVNEDSEVNGLDVDPFVAAVVGGATAQHAIPEPSTLLLALLALLAPCGLITATRVARSDFITPAAPR